MFCCRIDIRQWYFLAAVVTIAAAMTSCKKEQEKKTTAPFYQIDSLISTQVGLLASSKAMLNKQGYLKGKLDTVTYVPKDAAQWNKELDIFRELEAINKPINQSSYKVNDGLTDVSSNLTVKEIYTTNKDLPVTYLRIYYQNTPDKLRQIEALYRDGNAFYKGERLVSMQFRHINNQALLTSYSIQGGQKMVMDDSVSFTIRGKILVSTNYGETK